MELKQAQVQSIEEFVKFVHVLYEENIFDFATLFNAAIAGVQDIPPGTDPNVVHNWKNATIDDLTNFFVEWYHWNPDLSTGLEYIQKFSWLYYINDAGLIFVKSQAGFFLTYPFVYINGKKMDSPESVHLVEKWEKELGDIMNQYIIPEGGYTSFNQFFARELKPGMRPISSPEDDSVVVSPADAIINMIDDDLTLDAKLAVKTQKLSVTQLLDDSAYAKNFVGGTAVSCILMPTVYHRFHAPVSGIVVEANEDVAGNYFGISDFPKLINGGNVGYGYDYSVFEHFRRGYIIIETEDYGYVAVIPVGLNTIASVIFDEPYKLVNKKTKHPEIFKGQEFGYFQYGGSLNILLFEKGVFPAVRIPQGQIIGTMEPKSKGPKPQFHF